MSRPLAFSSPFGPCCRLQGSHFCTATPQASPALCPEHGLQLLPSTLLSSAVVTSVWLTSGCCALVTACSSAQVVAARVTALQAELSSALLRHLLPFPFAWLQSLELSGGSPAAGFQLCTAPLCVDCLQSKQLQGCHPGCAEVGGSSESFLPCWQRSCCFKRSTADSIDGLSK